MSSNEYYKERYKDRKLRGLCTQCGEPAEKSLCRLHLDKAHDRSKKWASENRSAYLEIKRDNYDKTREHQRNKTYVRTYGITTEDKEELLKNQSYKCAICLGEITLTSHLDHDHETDKIREILCQPCNHMLGLAKDNIDILISAIAYLNKHKLAA